MIEPLPEPNRTIHEPARLAILTVLSACRAADFLFLERATGLSRGNLSVQLSRLEEAGLVSISRRIVGKKTRTRVALTQRGAAEWQAYWRVMDELRRSAGAKPGRGNRGAAPAKGYTPKKHAVSACWGSVKNLSEGFDVL